jgi:hypothetical protein
MSEIDHLSSGGAEQLAARVREYWRQRGHAVDVWTERVEIVTEGVAKPFVFHVVRSNLFCGLPLPEKKAG